MPRILFIAAFLLAGYGVFGQRMILRTNNPALEQAFAWARYRALAFAHEANDPVGPWYEAALPKREAFCMRDVSHQAIGAEILGLGRHNENMFRKFAGNISAEKDYCSYWEINRYDKPAPVDYENDKDFWYNLPANFDLIYNAWRLYRWTGNRVYLDDPALKKFYALSLEAYVDWWDIGANEALRRNRSMHTASAARFGNHRGIPTYNEGGRAETLLGIDMTASLIAAYRAYEEMLRLAGEVSDAEYYGEKEEQERKFLEEFWWDARRGEYRTIYYADKSFDYFQVGDDQAYLHYLVYFGALEDSSRVSKVVELYRAHHSRLIVELKSYLPILFYEHGFSSLANELIIELCSPLNTRRDYPEISFTVIEHVVRGLLGVEPDAVTGKVVTLSRLESLSDWVELSNLSVLGKRVTITHNGQVSSSVTNHGSQPILWQASFYGNYPVIYVNGIPKVATRARRDGREISLVNISVPPDAMRSASIR